MNSGRTGWLGMADIELEKITDHETWISAVVMSAVTALERHGIDVQPIYARAKKDKALNVRLVIQGHEVPPEFFFDRFSETFDLHVDKRARELIEERMGGKLSEIDDALDDVRQGSKALAREHFPLWCDEDD